MAGHTPGPWKLGTVGDTRVHVFGPDWPDEGIIGKVNLCRVPGDGLANARLIAKAPELAEVLRLNLNAWDDEEASVQEEHAELIARTRALLAEIDGAEGRGER